LFRPSFFDLPSFIYRPSFLHFFFVPSFLPSSSLDQAREISRLQAESADKTLWTNPQTEYFSNPLVEAQGASELKAPTLEKSKSRMAKIPMVGRFFD
jgi:hypothetical protein